jgi:hypothetical protein
MPMPDAKPRRDQMLTNQVAPPVTDVPAFAVLHRFLVRLAIRRLNQRKETANVSRSRTT